jgi:hypothetical protein
MLDTILMRYEANILPVRRVQTEIEEKEATFLLLSFFRQSLKLSRQFLEYVSCTNRRAATRREGKTMFKDLQKAMNRAKDWSGDSGMYTSCR